MKQGIATFAGGILGLLGMIAWYIYETKGKNWIIEKTSFSKEKCNICGSKMKLKVLMSGEKKGHRYFICESWPSCKGKKLYAEQGKALEPWRKVGKTYTRN